jgi:hypothetical protein
MARSDRQVTQGSHHLGGAAVLDLMAIFVVGAVATIMEAVFDGPMITQRGAEREFAEFLPATAGDSKDRFGFDAAIRKLPAAIDSCDLRDMWEGQFAWQDRARLDRADLEASVTLFANVALRGKKPALGRAGCTVRARWVGCLSP